jgi:hypothetical protein
MPNDVIWHCIGEFPSTNDSPHQVLYIRRSETARYQSKPTAGHNIKIIHSLTFVATVALLFPVGKYVATYRVLVGTV